MTIDTDANDQFQFHIKQVQRTNSNSPQKPAYNRSSRSTIDSTSIELVSFSLSDLGRRTYEGLDEEPMMDVDYDEEYDNQFNGMEEKTDYPSANLKRMKQSPRGKV